MFTAILLAMFLPGSLFAIVLLRIAGAFHYLAPLRNSLLIVCIGQAIRFTGIALIVLTVTRSLTDTRLDEMAALDRASPFQTWYHIHWPRRWPLMLGTFILIVMFSITELPATMVLLPAGAANFAQRLLNQMHYARDQQVIASCLVMISVFVLLTLLLVSLVSLKTIRNGIKLLILSGIIIIAGCDNAPTPDGLPQISGTFGRTGYGSGEFVYPRAIDIDSDGILYVIDKTGRIQQFDRKYNCIGRTSLLTSWFNFTILQRTILQFSFQFLFLNSLNTE